MRFISSAGALALLVLWLCAAGSSIAQAGERSGRQVVDAQCSKCHLEGKGGAPLRAAVSRNTEAHARDPAPAPAELQAQGVTSLRGIAEALNARGMLTRRGGRR